MLVLARGPETPPCIFAEMLRPCFEPEHVKSDTGVEFPTELCG
jgi:hypothetical protein